MTSYTDPVQGPTAFVDASSSAATVAPGTRPGRGRPRGGAPRLGVRRPSALTRSGRSTPPATLAQRIFLIVLLAGTAALYLWNLGINGWGNAFYSAAIQAGSQNWEAFLFGSSDPGNSITVDKPPASLWIPALSVRLFGLNSWSILVPEALMGVASVWLVYLTLSRVSGRWVGLVGGAALATTPVALLMFRFNNPEALLILLSVAAVYGVVRAVQAGADRANGLVSKRGRGALGWMVFVGVMIGLGFLTKQLQAVVIVPTLALAYLVAARGPWLRRIGHLFAAAAAMVLSAGWWVALVELWPAESRPYIGGSQGNSFLELTFGYNGLGRLNGEENGSVGSHWGTPSLLRLLSGNYLSQISWLIPAAGIALIACLVLALRTRAWRSDGGRLRIAAIIAFGGWFVVEGLTISLMQGITHEYYTAILAAPIAAIVAIGAGWLWERSRSWTASLTLAALVVATALMAFIIALEADWGSVAAACAAVLGFVGAFALALRPLWAGHQGASPVSPRLRRGLAIGAVGAVLIGGLGAQTAFAASTVTVAKTGSIIYAGSSNMMGGPGGPGGMGGGPGGGGQGGQGGPGGTGIPGGTPPGGTSNGGTGMTPPGGTTQGGATQGGITREDGTRGAGGGMGGLLGTSEPSEEIVALLQANASSYRWSAATTGSQNAAGYQLGSDTSVMPIGGFNGTDDSPTLEQFKAWVSEGQIHYYIASSEGGGMGGDGGQGGQGAGPGGVGGGTDSASSAISTWVSENYTATTVDGVTMYDLTQPAS